jgi:uncharacterized protein (DUF305 family)
MLSHALLLAAVIGGTLSVQAQSPTRVMGAPYHDASRAFIDMMVPHHDMAVMMSNHALSSARTDAVKQMARRMIAEQTKEIAELKAARRALFGSDSARVPMMRAMMQMMGMQHMGDTGTSRAMMDSMARRRAQAAPGAQHGAMMPMGMMGDFDRMFLQHMISHHEDGIEMSVLAEHSQAAARVRELAKQIREGQERDIVEMRRLLAALPAAHPATH